MKKKQPRIATDTDHAARESRKRKPQKRISFPVIPLGPVLVALLVILLFVCGTLFPPDMFRAIGPCFLLAVTIFFFFKYLLNDRYEK